MKKWLLIMTLLLCVCFSIAALAEEEPVESFDLLSSKSLTELVKAGEYEDWELFQPHGEDMFLDSSSEKFLSKTSIFPVVARKDGEVHLIVLQKKDKTWEIRTVNKQALVREGLTLCGFGIDENTDPEDLTTETWFNFRGVEGTAYTLNMVLDNEELSIYPWYLTRYDPNTENCNYSIYAVYNRIFDWALDVDEGAFRQEIRVKAEKDYDFTMEGFSLAEYPISLEELAFTAKTAGKAESIGLYRYPVSSDAPLKEIPGGEEVQVVRISNSDNWVIVLYEGQMYFATNSSVVMTKEEKE